MKIEMIKAYIEKNMDCYSYLFDDDTEVSWTTPEVTGDYITVVARYNVYYSDIVKIPIIDLMAFLFEMSVDR